MKKLMSVLLSLLMVFSLFSVSAFAEGETEEKTEEPEKEYDYKAEEVIYGILGADGKAEKFVPVVIIDALKDTKLNYYGDFTEVQNLSGTDELDYSDGAVKLQLPKGKLYFRAELASVEVPWLIDIHYFMDGKEIAPEKLGGMSGHLEIEIGVKQNEKADPSFFENYLAQISMSLNSEKCRNIEAEGATVANAGANKMLNFMAMPGAEFGFKVSADVENFSMGGMSIAAVPLSMADMLSGENIEELTDGLNQLSYGVASLNNGAWQLSSGMNEFSAGLNQLSSGSESLRSGSAQILEGMKMISSVAGSMGEIGGDIDLSNLSTVPQAIYAAADGLDSAAGTVEGMKTGVDNIISQVGAPLAGVVPVDEGEINALVEANPDNAALQSLINNSNAALSAKAGWDANSGSLTQISNDLSLASDAIRLQAEQLRAAAAALEEIINSGEAENGSQEIVSRLEQLAGLADNYQLFHDGLVQYTQGVDALAEASTSLAGGTAALAGGTSQLNDGTSTIPDEVDSMINPGEDEKFKPHSFLSDKNENVSAVQFVFTTRSIDIPEQTDLEAVNTNEESGFSKFVDRFSALFKSPED